MSKQVNYRNILLARESRGATQKGVAAAIDGLSQGNLSKMEKGLLPVNEKIIEKIANYLNFPVSFFYKDSPNASLNTLFYRKRVTIPAKELSMVEAKFDLARIAVDELLDSVEIPDFDVPSIEVSDNMDPQEIARRIRLFLQLPKGPIMKPVKVLEKHGIIVIFLNGAPDKFFGVTMFTNKMRPIIFINDNKSNDNKRFTLGHELGHLVMHLRNDVYSKEDKELDKEADAFSSEYNMPSDECKGDLLNLKFKNLSEIKMYWRLSKAAITRKAKDLGILSQSQYKYFMMQLSSNGERIHEKEFVDIDQPSLLKLIIKVHLDSLDYNISQLAELTGLSEEDMFDFISYDQLVKPKLRIVRHWA